MLNFDNFDKVYVSCAQINTADALYKVVFSMFPMVL